MAKLDSFHPQFQASLCEFLARANLLFLQFPDPTVQAKVSSRPVLLHDGLHFNAWVGRAEDGYAIYTVTAGVIAALVDICITLSATKTFFPEVETRGKVREMFTLYDSSHFIAYHRLHGDKGEALPLIPIRVIHDDPIRESLGIALFDLASRFLMFHEQMHFIRGHLHYIFGPTSPRALEEIPSDISSAVPASKRRALELDADGSAFAQLLKLFDQRETMLYKFSPFITNEWEWARVVTLSSLVVTLLLSIVDDTIHAHSERHHPTPQVRILNILQVLITYQQNLPGFGKGAPHPSILRLFMDVATLSKVLRVSPPSSSAFTEWQSVESQKYRHPICKELREHLDLLENILPDLR
jgi:hypothetical protein